MCAPQPLRSCSRAKPHRTRRLTSSQSSLPNMESVSHVSSHSRDEVALRYFLVNLLSCCGITGKLLINGGMRNMSLQTLRSCMQLIHIQGINAATLVSRLRGLRNRMHRLCLPQLLLSASLCCIASAHWPRSQELTMAASTSLISFSSSVMRFSL